MKEKDKVEHRYVPETVPDGQRRDHRIYPGTSSPTAMDDADSDEGPDMVEEERQAEWKYAPGHRRPQPDEAGRGPKP